MSGNIILPDATTNGTPITSIDVNVFKGNTAISNVVFPSSYTSIPQRAFESSSLISVDLSQTKITEIPDYAFYKANLSSINLPEGLLRIGYYAFRESTLPSIAIPDSLQTLDTCALWDIRIKSIFIPKNVRVLADFVLYSSNLQQIVVDEENANYYDIEDIALASYSGDLIMMASKCKLTSFTIPDNIATLKSNSLYDVSTLKTLNIGSALATIKNTSLPRNLQTISVDSNNPNFVSENNNALYNKAKTQLYSVTSTLTNFVMPDSLTIGSDSTIFEPVRNSLQYVTLNKTVSDLTFLGQCAKILSISVPAENTNFVADNRAIFSANGKTIIKYFGGNSATTYTVPDGVTKINPLCFYYSTLQSVVLPDGLNVIDTQAFYDANSLSSINIPNSVTAYGSYVFSKTKLTSFVVSSNVTTILSNILQYTTTLTNVEFYNTTIPELTCNNCTSLKNVIVGSNVTSIGSQAFQDCKALESVEFQGTTPPTLASANAFLNTNSTFKIYVPDSAVSAYKSAQYFSQYASQIYPVSSRA